MPGIAGIDTRALTKLLREKGTMNGMITTDAHYKLDEVLPRLKAYTTGKVVEKVTCKEKYTLKGSRNCRENGALSGSAKFVPSAYAAGEREKKPSLVKTLNGIGRRVALLDLGTKDNIAYSLKIRGCDVTVYPATTPAEEIIVSNPDGIMLSNTPGDPKECTAIIAEIKKLYDTEIPILRFASGHQLMARLQQGQILYKMKYGHRGATTQSRIWRQAECTFLHRIMVMWWIWTGSWILAWLHRRLSMSMMGQMRG